MRRICVYCGSSPGARPDYTRAARELGDALAREAIELVYGGAKVGTMAAVADATIERGGVVIGVMPRFLVDKEIAHEGLTELRVTETMHERKQMMIELADAFVALPGGLGTLEELFETLTWAQLGLHSKACGLLNVCGFYDKLLDFLDQCVGERLVPAAHREMLLVENDVETLLQNLADFKVPKVEKWLDRHEK